MVEDKLESDLADGVKALRTDWLRRIKEKRVKDASFWFGQRVHGAGTSMGRTWLGEEDSGVSLNILSVTAVTQHKGAAPPGNVD